MKSSKDYKDYLHLLITPSYKVYEDFIKLYPNMKFKFVYCEEDLLGYNPKKTILIDLDPLKDNSIWNNKAAVQRVKIMIDDNPK